MNIDFDNFLKEKRNKFKHDEKIIYDLYEEIVALNDQIDELKDNSLECEKELLELVEEVEHLNVLLRQCEE